uniref:Ubiquinol-cytochrome c reductase complex assembly factor 1 n=1 Tax=Eptatretus burgeri TaxID=7764 RepID=A0A8C4R5K7_EPTBU
MGPTAAAVVRLSGMRRSLTGLATYPWSSLFDKPTQLVVREHGFLPCCSPSSAWFSSEQYVSKNHPPLCINAPSSHCVHTTTTAATTAITTTKLPGFKRMETNKLGVFARIIEAFGVIGPMRHSKWKLRIAALRMYTCCVEDVVFEQFVKQCQLPDTLSTWFLVTQLHVWMCLVRMKQEGREGNYMCKYIVYAMWEDLQQRSAMMKIDQLKIKQSMKAMTEMFYASLFGYDEGILSDDHILLAALWRHLFSFNLTDPRHLELMVEYVRKQVQYLDSFNSEDLLLTGTVRWRPLHEKNPQSVLKADLPAYNDAGL